MSEFFAMGGHGGFIWPAYGVVLVVLLGLWWINRRSLIASEKELQTLETQRPKRSRRDQSAAPGDVG